MSSSPDIPGFAATAESPWLGLRSFTEDARGFFFGRAAEVDDLYARILDKPLAILFGQSGLGKSSLLQAALIPRLRQAGFLPVILRFDHNTDARPLEHQLLSHLYDALTAAGYERHAVTVGNSLAWRVTAADGGYEPEAPSAGPAQVRKPIATELSGFLWLLFHDPAHGFLPGRADSAEKFPRPVFLIDQFEEIFTLGDRPARRDLSLAFRDTLAALIENRPPASVRARLESDDALAERLDYNARPARFLLSLREDFLHLLERWRRLMPSLMENRMELRLLNGPQALLAVVRPGQLRPGQPALIPDDVGRAIVRFVSGVKEDVPLEEIDAVPPLLSLVCAELNAQRLALNEQQISRTQFEGSSDKILESFYARSFDPATYGSVLAGISQRNFALQGLRVLVEDRLLSSDGFRESIAFATIAHDLARTVTPDIAKIVLDAVIERRLLTVEERGGVRRLELAHDVLTRIVKRSRDERHELASRSKAISQKRFAEAEARRASVDRKRDRRLTILAASLALMVVISSIIAWIEFDRSRDALHAEMDATSALALKSDEVTRARGEVAAAKSSENKSGALLAASDLREATHLIEQNNLRDAIPYLAHALSIDPTFDAALTRLTTLLTYHSWLPQSRALKHDQPILSAEFNGDGSRILTTSGATNLSMSGACLAQVWDAGTGKVTAKLNVAGPPHFSQDGRLILFASGTNLQAWNADNGQAVSAQRQGPVDRASRAFNLGGTRSCTVSTNTALLRNELTGEVLIEIKDVNLARFSDDGKCLLTASADHVQVWNAASGDILTERQSANAVRLCYNGRRILTVSTNRVQIWSLETAELLRESENANAVRLIDDGMCVLTVSTNGVKILSLVSGSLMTEIESPSLLRFDGSSLRLGSANDTQFWNVGTGQTIALPTQPSTNDGFPLFTHDGGRLITFSAANMQIWNARTSSAIGSPIPYPAESAYPQVSPDETKVLVVFSNSVQIWDIESGKMSTELKHSDTVRSAQFSPTGRKVLTASDDHTVRVWDTATGQQVTEPLPHPVLPSSAQLDPNGGRILTVSGDIAHIWDFPQLIPTLSDAGWKESAPPSDRAGKRTVRISDELGAYTAMVEDSETGAEIAVLKHSGKVKSAQFSPDGQRIVTASDDCTARVWDAHTGSPLSEPFRHRSPVVSARFSSNGSEIITICANHAVSAWDIAPASSKCPDWLLELAEAISGEIVNEQGLLEPTKQEPAKILSQVRARLDHESSNDQWNVWGRWLLADPFARTISPLSSVSVRDFIYIRIKSGRLEDLDDLAPLALARENLLSR